MFEENKDWREHFEEKSKHLNIRKGLNDFLELKRLRPNTIFLYKYSVEKLIEACGEKDVSNYSINDYKKLLMWFEKKRYSENTKGIITAHLHALFNYFLSVKEIKENVIKKIPRKVKLPECYDDNDLKVILNYL
ncbi:MAG: hypothetical protein ACOYU5_00895 [Stygiobacter sp.]